MGKFFLVLAICLALLAGSYAAARVTAGQVVGDNPKSLGTLTSRFERNGIQSLPGHPRAWVIAYPKAVDLAKGGAEIYVSLTGKLLGTRPADLADQMAARRRADP